MKLKHFMLDLETWGTGPFSSIIAVGLVYFDPNVQSVITTDGQVPERNFYVTIDPIENEKAGFRLDASTISWWLNPTQRPAWDEWMKPAHFGPQDAFNAVSMWLDEIDHIDPPDPVQGIDAMSPEKAYEASVSHRIVWGNGPGFDNELAKQAHKLLNMPLPWGYQGDRCFRTMKNLPRAKDVRPSDTGLQHNALSDALYQARWLQNIVREYSLTI